MPPDTFTDFSIHVAPTSDGGTDVAIFGELDLATSDKAKDAIDSAIARSGDVVIDLRACPFVDSTGIGVLAQAAVRLREQKRTLTLRGVRDRVRRILDLAGLTKPDLVVVEPSVDHRHPEAGDGS
jgi:anti-sigma B factor antagonist